ncbi:MAG: amidohydrolase family protein [Phenylobacterium sp.]|uniref:amidohydrolase family protein n=1 Tax=Phenylobacterium sp. TaxID=1871053 RepID=UPI0025DD14E8|nr:amidohydrolase family protein [Phenylobacterium sp.]MBI1197828.1 amidohydrolase family protein [Phenylobacterium sp.]
MTYVSGRIVHDADSHVMETREWLDPFLDAALKGELKPLYGREPGRIDKLLDAAKARKGDAEAEARALDNAIAGPKGWSAFGAFDADERRRVLDSFGFSSQLVFATSSLAPALAAKTEDALYGGVRAHNLAMGAFCAGDPRLIGVAYVPLDNPARALEETNAALEAGNGAIWVSAGPAGERSPGHPDFDPIWARLCEADVPFVLHIGPGTKTQPKAFRNNGRERAPDLHGGGENLRFADYIMLSFAPQVFLTAMVYDGVFERFPKLRGGVIEAGAGWAPEFLRELDLGFKSFKRTDPYLQAMPMTPSQYIRRAIKFTPFPGEDVGRMIADGGAELFMFSSDYPHPEGTNDPLGRFERTMGDLDEASKEKFYRTNFEEMIGPGGMARTAEARRPALASA